MNKRLLRSYHSFDYEKSLIKESVGDTSSDVIVLSGILQKADTLNQNGRIYPRHILEREVRNYQKFILENRALGECVPPGTQIYTRDGWKNIEDISEDEIIATLNVSNNELEFQRITKKIVLDYEGKMYRFKNANTYDMRLTGNHKILVWDRNGKSTSLTASELWESYQNKDSHVSHMSLRRTSDVWKGENPEFVVIGDKTIDAQLWAAFLGIYLAEGCVDGTKRGYNVSNTIQITQKNKEVIISIRSLLEKLPWKFNEILRKDNETIDFITTDKDLHKHLFVLGNSRTKYIPLYAKNWSKELLQTLLDWMLLGDGRHRHNVDGTLIPEYCTSSKVLADDVYDVMLKLGPGATINTYQPVTKPSPDFEKNGRMILKENQAPMNIISQSRTLGMSLDFRFMQAEVSDYIGKVYCVTVRNSTWLMKQNGKVCWTHNCDHPDSSVVSLKNVSHVVTEAYLDGDVVYGKIRLLNTPSGKILQNLVADKVKLGISSRGVGSTERRGDYQIVQDDFQLICWDVVSEPSTPMAFMLPEQGKNESYQQDNLIENVIPDNDKIYKILKELSIYKK